MKTKKRNTRNAQARSSLARGSVLHRIALLEEPIKFACEMLRYVADNTDIDEENSCACHNLALRLESTWNGHASYVAMPPDVRARMERYEELLRIAANNAHDEDEGEDSFERTINKALELSPLPSPNP